MHLLPAQRACTRRFGYECLAQYYPRRCGGLNPVTMLRQFRYSRIVVASRHMADEYARHGFGAKVRVVLLPVEGRVAQRSGETDPNLWRLLYLGRFERTKGTAMALETAALVARSTRRRVSLQISGDGSLSQLLQERARQLMKVQQNLTVTFSGWLSPEECVRAFDHADLLLVPSAWPEPFGLVGIEAGLRGLPTVAFAVGGIPEWLQDNVNGRVIHAATSDANQFAAAIASCLTDPATLDRMQKQSCLAALRFSMAAHIKELEAVLSEVMTGPPARS